MDGVDCTIPYSTNNYLLKAAGLYVINNEEAQEYGLQLGAKADDSILVLLSMCWGRGEWKTSWIGWE